MAFRRITGMDKYEIIRRWHHGDRVLRISAALGYDRKTVRSVIRQIMAKGISKHLPLPDRETIIALCSDTTSSVGRTAEAQIILEQYLDQIKKLIDDPDNPLKAKHAFDVLCSQHSLAGKVSYTSFKRFVLNHPVHFSIQRKSTCRIETDPGEEIQIDYAKLGVHHEPGSTHGHIAYLFIGTLSHSRHKYVEVVYTQNQQSFIESHIRMFAYFGGVPKRLVIDNLKTGVISPDLYDPKINRSYAELAEYYNTFIDPCRVRKPQDKGKVERDVQTLRDLARKLRVLYPLLSASQLSDAINRSVREEYGARNHGTTGEKPYEVFSSIERQQLKALPETPFVIAIWKTATVHPDHYIQFEKQAFSVPTVYIGKTVWVRGTEKFIQIFFGDRLIKQHIRTQRKRHTDLADFPENIQAALDKGMPLWIQGQAALIGPHFRDCIRKVLQPNVFTNMRRAQGLLSTARKYSVAVVEQAAQKMLAERLTLTHKIMLAIISQLICEQTSTPPLSPETQDFMRAPDYYTYS